MFTGKQDGEAEPAWSPVGPGPLSRGMMSTRAGQRAGRPRPARRSLFAVKAWSAALPRGGGRLRRARQGQVGGEQGKAKGEKRGLGSGKDTREDLCSQTISGARRAGETALGRPLRACSLAQRRPPLAEVCSEAAHVGLI